MLIINMFGPKSKFFPEAEDIRTEIDSINLAQQLNENEAIVLSRGRWFYYANNTLESLLLNNDHYNKLMAHYSAPCGFRQMENHPSREECIKLFNNTSQYIYSRRATCLYYYDASTQDLTPIDQNYGSRAPYESNMVVNYLTRGDVWGNGDLERPLPIQQLTQEELTYITYATGHSQRKFSRLEGMNKTLLVNNRIDNELLNRKIDKLALAIGLCAMVAGGLLGAFVFAGMILSPAAPIVMFMTGLMFASIALAVFFLAAMIIGKVTACLTGQYKKEIDFTPKVQVKPDSFFAQSEEKTSDKNDTNIELENYCSVAQ